MQEADKSNKYPNNMTADDMNQYMVDQLFQGYHEKTIPVIFDDKDSKEKPKYTLTYRALTSGDEVNLARFFTYIEDDGRRSNKQYIVQSAHSIIKINGVPVTDQFKLHMFEKHESDDVVLKTIGGLSDTMVERNVEKNPLSDFEKRYLVFSNMQITMVILFHTNFMGDTHQFIDNLIGSDDKADTPATKTGHEKDKDNDPLVSPAETQK